MKIITSLSFSALLLIIATTTVLAQTPIKARTESGKEVILLPDGTWRYEVAISEPTSSAANKPAEAKTLFKPTQGGFGIWYDNSKWAMVNEADAEGRVHFKLKRGDGYAFVLIEELGIPISTLREVALENAKAAAPDARIIFEENRTVNKTQVLCMKIEGTVKGIPFRYYGYYYGGKQGTIQVLTFTGQRLFEKYEQDFNDFLNGLEIY
jgi:hypothetical protein